MDSYPFARVISVYQCHDTCKENQDNPNVVMITLLLHNYYFILSCSRNMVNHITFDISVPCPVNMFPFYCIPNLYSKTEDFTTLGANVEYHYNEVIC